MADFILIDHGSITILRGATDAAREWIDTYLPDDAMQWAGGVVIEPRYVDAIVSGLLADDLTLTMI